MYLAHVAISLILNVKGNVTIFVSKMLKLFDRNEKVCTIDREAIRMSI